MRSRAGLFIVLAAALMMSLGGNIAQAYQAGDKVDIEWSGAWYPGRVKEAKDGKYFIAYEGYDSSWDEWVGTERLRLPGGEEPSPAAEAPVSAPSEAVRAPGKTPKPAVVAEQPKEITIRKSGSIWAVISPQGTIRVNGSIEGEVAENGNVRVSGMNSGEIDAGGTIRKNGMIVGSIESDGTLRGNGSTVGSIENNGTIRNQNMIWGEANQSCKSRRNRHAVAAVVVFFAGADFGF